MLIPFPFSYRIYIAIVSMPLQSLVVVLKVVMRLEKQLETLPYSCDPPEWEALLVQFNKELHPDHFLCMKVGVIVFVFLFVFVFVIIFVIVFAIVFVIAFACTRFIIHLATTKQLQNDTTLIIILQRLQLCLSLYFFL